VINSGDLIFRSCTPMSASLTSLSAADARDAMIRGDVTAEAYVGACLDAIEAREAEIEAWVVCDRAHALEQARACDTARAAGKPAGLLHGLPVGIKDIIDTADMPTQNGSPLFKGHQPIRDASCVAQIRGQGGVVIGKTVTTELANNHPNKTRNPHNPAHTPGGSSSGSAAAVGARTIPLALGTQTGGSVIRPGSFCGVYAMKPTLGLISRTGATLQSHTLDTIGVYGRSVADLALATDAMSAFDAEDAVSYPRASLHLSAGLAWTRADAPRFAFLRSPAWSQAEAAAQRALEDFAKGFRGQVTEIDVPEMADVITHHANVMSAENVAYYGPLQKRNPEVVSSTLTARLKASEAVTAGDYIRSVNAREPMYAALARTLAGYDAILTLPACGPAPKGLASTGNPVFNAMWTYLGVPCITLPLMQVDGLPLGVQLVGPRRGEAHLLAVAQWLDARARG
jgi:Asp-tRNA(Asn)/Glu-tRNA(Gln) amidotransferase A subunit family amidase